MIGPGAKVGEFEVWGRIGGGGMSDVWLARHVTLAMPLVLKTMRPESGVCENDRYAHMLNEARTMARVHSSLVVRALDVGTYGGAPYVAQEYVDGVDLNEVDKRRRRGIGRGLPLWYVCSSVAAIAQGLHAAHRAGVLHRDVKPSNLFGSPEAGLKLGDFGIAVAKGIGERAASEVGGTLRFMAPEALRGDELDRRADVYGLGATAFDLRYGRPPFDDIDRVLAGHARPAFPPPASAEEAYFQHVVTRMLAPDREERYRDMNEPRRLLSTLATTTHRPARTAALPDGSVLFGTTRVVCEVGDIAVAREEGIVNSSGPDLSMSAGEVARALAAAGGGSIEREAQAGGPQPLGTVVITGPGRLACRYLLHAVSAWQETSCVGRATQRAFLVADELGLRSLALPALGTGFAGVALEAAASAETYALRNHLLLGGSRLSEVHFVLADEGKLRAFREVLESILLGESDDRPDEIGLEDAAEACAPSGPTYVVPDARP